MNPAHLLDHPLTDLLPRELLSLLAVELGSGNRVTFTAGTGQDPRTALLVVLAEPFLSRPEELPEGVSYHEGEHDWWQCEYRTGDPLCVLAAAPCA